tara:strand:- start:319 stop:552 length:234 start_codon:yes stop_codon:yes gene_type:complete
MWHACVLGKAELPNIVSAHFSFPASKDTSPLGLKITHALMFSLPEDLIRMKLKQTFSESRLDTLCHNFPALFHVTRL